MVEEKKREGRKVPRELQMLVTGTIVPSQSVKQKQRRTENTSSSTKLQRGTKRETTEGREKKALSADKRFPQGETATSASSKSQGPRPRKRGT